MVITSYEGQHDHDMPASRSVTHNSTGPNIHTTAIQNGESCAKSGERDILSLDMVGHYSSDSIGKSKQQLNGESKSKLKGNDVTGVDAVIDSSSGHASKSNEQQNGKSSTIEQSDAAGLDMAVNASSVPEGMSNAQHNGKSRMGSKENGYTRSVHAITSGLESNPCEPHVPNSDPVQS